MRDRARVRVVVTGRVQGVWFRSTCARLAREAGLGGWVRNRADGTVEAVFEGSSAAVQRMVAWCEHGPAGAEVTGLERFEEPVEGLEGFTITG